MYSAKISKPNNAQEGVTNFVQMIINELEAGNTREALLKAVDLRADLMSEVYEIKMQEVGSITIDITGINTR